MIYSKKIAILSCFLSLAVSGCDSAVTDFVKETPPPPRVTPIPPAVTTGSLGIKISPGRLLATSADVQAEGNVTITKRSLTSSDVGAEISMSRPYSDP